ncbi:MAG TPA: hypothetical protein PL147_04845 [Bacilli bacterium]|nr:hypothetical protein [Bacilli bacterium]
MGVNYFTDEQVKILKANPNVKNVSNKAITYTDQFKEHFVNEYNKGKLPIVIFEDVGLSVKILGKIRIQESSRRFRKQAERLEGFNDTRSTNSGRPLTKHLTKDEIINRQKAEIEYLKQEREFLLELKRLEREVIRKSKSKPKTNTK